MTILFQQEEKPEFQHMLLIQIRMFLASTSNISVANWDTNGDGELSYAEAAAVTDLGTYFKGNSTIESFDELQYFTSLTTLPNTAFMNCTSLASVSLPSSIESLGNGAFLNCNGLDSLTVFAETPPSVGAQSFVNVSNTIPVYIPCDSYDAYQSASCVPNKACVLAGADKKSLHFFACSF